MKIIGTLAFEAWMAGQKIMYPDSDDFDNWEAWARMPEKEKSAWQASVNKIIELLTKSSE